MARPHFLRSFTQQPPIPDEAMLPPQLRRLQQDITARHDLVARQQAQGAAIRLPESAPHAAQHLLRTDASLAGLYNMRLSLAEHRLDAVAALPARVPA